MNVMVSPSQLLSSIGFSAWMRTCVDLADALGRGSGIVALVGPAGSGKTYTLSTFASAPAQRGRVTTLRTASQPAVSGAALDLVDDVTADHLMDLIVQRDEGARRVIAIRPDILPRIQNEFPDVEVVAMRPMPDADRLLFLQTRCKDYGLPERVVAELMGWKPRPGEDCYPGHLDAMCRTAADAVRWGGHKEIPGDSTDVPSYTHDSALDLLRASSASIVVTQRTRRWMRYGRNAGLVAAPLLVLLLIWHNLPGPDLVTPAAPAPAVATPLHLDLALEKTIPSTAEIPVLAVPQITADAAGGEQAGRLIALGRILDAIGQSDDAKAIFDAVAKRSGKEAAAVMASYQHRR